MERLGRGEAPFALARFDARGFADPIRRRFGARDDAPFVGIDVCDFTGSERAVGANRARTGV